MFNYTDHFDTEINWYEILSPIAHKAITEYGDRILSDKEDIETEIDGYIVWMVNNDVINQPLFSFLFPEYKDSKCQININISKKEWNNRGYGFIYQYINNKWISEEK